MIAAGICGLATGIVLTQTSKQEPQSLTEAPVALDRHDAAPESAAQVQSDFLNDEFKKGHAQALLASREPFAVFRR